VTDRAQTSDYLSGRSDERPPLLALVTALAARIEGVDVDAMERDPSTLSRSMLTTRQLLKLPVLTLRWPTAGLEQAAVAGSLAATESAAVVTEAVHRLRILVGADTALAVLLPGPATLVAALGGDAGSFDDLEDAAVDVLNTLKAIEPQSVDVFGVFERVPVDGARVDDLADVLGPVWNSAHYFSAPAVFFAAEADAAAARIGADAVAVLSGASAEDLLAAGARRAGVPIGVGDAADVAPLPPGGFYVSRGELDPEAAIDQLTALVEGATR
jgi:hypothetical protein